MPEGDTIWRTADALRRAIGGRVVTRFWSADPRLTRVDEDAPLAGRVVEDVRAAGKHLLLRFSGGLTLRSHMRMSGSWHLYRPAEEWQRARSAARVVVGTDAFVAVAFDVNDMEFLDERGLARQADLARQGPDVLAEAFDEDEALRRLRSRPQRGIHDALLDQSVVAGIGNIWKSETLFAERTNPFLAVGELEDGRLRRILKRARKLMLASATGGSAPAGGHDPHGRRGDSRSARASRRWVYGRAGKPCPRCGTAILAKKTGLDARATWWCPSCQPAVGAPGSSLA